MFPLNKEPGPHLSAMQQTHREREFPVTLGAELSPASACGTHAPRADAPLEKSEKLVVNYGLVLRNAGLNLAGHILPAIAAVVSIPIIIRGLGMERYGILSLALVIVTYFALFDFGLGDATTKFVAGALGRGEPERLPFLIWTSLALIGVLGLTAGSAMFAVSPLLARKLLNLSLGLQGEATNAFRAMAMAVPFMLLASGLRGTLEAQQRYDLVNAVTIPTNVANYVVPIAAIYLHVGLVPIMACMAIVRAVTCLAFFLLSLRLFPEVRHTVTVNFREARPLMVFGGWLAISNLTWPVLLYMDRLVIGSVAAVAVVPFYAAPCDIVTRLWILPASWVALFPAFSAVGEDRFEEVADMCARGVKHLALLMGPIVIFSIFFARTILHTWLGGNFADRSTLAFQILALGVLVNSVGSVPDRLVKGLGRPEMIAKLHITELPIYAVLLYLSTKEWGIVGTAIVWSLRCLIEAAIVFAISARLVPSSGEAMKRAGGWSAAVSLCLLTLVMFGVRLLFRGVPLAAASSGVLVCFVAASWYRVLDDADRSWILSAVRLKSARQGALY